MKACKFLHITLPILLGSFLSSTPACAQPNDTKVQLKDSVKLKDSIRYDYIYIGQKGQNKFTFLGRDFGQNTAFTSTDLLYYLHFNVWISASQFFFAGNDIPPQTGIAAGYYLELSPKTDVSISYSQFLVSNNTNVTGLNSQGFAQAAFGLDWNFLYSTIQFQSLISNSPDFFVVSQHSRYFEFNKLLWRKIQVSFEPKASFTFGTDRFNYVTYPEDTIRSNGGNGKGKGKGKGQGKPSSGPGTEPEEEEENGKKIKALNWEVFFPLTFALNRFALELNTRYTYPLNVAYNDISKPTFVFGAELNYYIPVKKKRNRL